MNKPLLLLIPLICLFPTILFSNPQEPPPIVTEVYFDENDDWTLEFYIDDEWYAGIVNLDSLRINDAILKDEVTVEMGIPLVITPEMLNGDLEISRVFGELHVSTWDNRWIGLDWSTYWASNTHPILPDQSLAVLKCFHNSTWDPTYLNLHNYPPTLGYDVYSVQGTGTWQGHIYDLNGIPIPDVNFECDVTLAPLTTFLQSNDEGFFSGEFLSGYHYIYYYHDDPFFSNSITTEWIKIDSVVVFDIIAPIYLTNTEDNEYSNCKINCYPNPCHDYVNFNIEIPHNHKFKSGNIIIHELSGNLIWKLPIMHSQIKSGRMNISWSLPAEVQGVYIYFLELDNQNIASEKLMVSK